MTTQQIIEMLQNRLVNLAQLRTSAVVLGDIEQVAKIDADTAESQNTLNQLLSL